MNKIRRRLLAESKHIFGTEYHVDLSKYNIEVYQYKDEDGTLREYEVKLTSKTKPPRSLTMSYICVNEDAIDSENTGDFILQYMLDMN